MRTFFSFSIFRFFWFCCLLFLFFTSSVIFHFSCFPFFAFFQFVLLHFFIFFAFVSLFLFFLDVFLLFCFSFFLSFPFYLFFLFNRPSRRQNRKKIVETFVSYKGRFSKNIRFFGHPCKVTSRFHFFFSKNSFFFHLLFLCFSFFSCPSRRQNWEKNRRTVPIVKRTISFCENSIFGSRWAGGGRGRNEWPILRVTLLSCFSFFFSFFKFSLFFASLTNVSCFASLSLLALVSEFNCFLRSRCTLETWCLDDMGRESWHWFWPPAWERACFNSPEWRGGSSPVKTEPLQIVLL